MSSRFGIDPLPPERAFPFHRVRTHPVDDQRPSGWPTLFWLGSLCLGLLCAGAITWAACFGFPRPKGTVEFALRKAPATPKLKPSGEAVILVPAPVAPEPRP